MKPTDLVTLRLNSVVPQCAIKVEANAKGISYLHPTKGWRQVSWERVGVKPMDA